MFENNKAIYLQIADRICDDILAGRMKGGERLPSVREYGAMVQVNPNTVMRTYEHLSRNEVIYNRRGIGFFVSDDAMDIIRRYRAEEILTHRLGDLFEQLRLLGVSPDDLFERYTAYLSNPINSQQQ